MRKGKRPAEDLICHEDLSTFQALAQMRRMQKRCWGFIRHEDLPISQSFAQMRRMQRHFSKNAPICSDRVVRKSLNQLGTLCHLGRCEIQRRLRRAQRQSAAPQLKLTTEYQLCLLTFNYPIIKLPNSQPRSYRLRYNENSDLVTIRINGLAPRREHSLQRDDKGQPQKGH